MEQVAMTAWPRAIEGKGSAKRVRKEGFVPAVLYGAGVTENILLKLKKLDLERAIQAHAGGNFLMNLTIEGGKERIAMLKDLERNPVSGYIEHIDLINVLMDKKIVAKVPVHISGKAVGIGLGGILQQETRTIRVECLPKDIPNVIDVDVTNLGLGQSLHISDLKMPQGVKVLDDPGFTIVLVSMPTEEAAPVKSAEEAQAEIAKSFEVKEEEGAEGEAAPAAKGAAPAKAAAPAKEKK